jgi:mannose/fructose/N-acetylgalactosamine-specific phosphotransferase system component IIC
MFDWWVYRLFVLNTTVKPNSSQMMIFVIICSTWNMVYFKSRFDTSITRNDVKGVSLFHLSHLITLIAYMCSQWTPNAQIKYFMFDCLIYRVFMLNWAWKRVSLQIMVFVCVLDVFTVELNTRFETWITRNYVNGVSLFNLSYLITIMVYLCSQRKPNVKMNNFMFDWSMHVLFVLNRGWKHVSL